MDVNHLTGNIYGIPIDTSRAFVLEDTPAGENTLVDTGYERTGDEVVSTLQSEFTRIDRVILTHSGGDHYGGLNHVVEAFDPEIYAAAGETELLDSIDHEPDVKFDDGDVLPGGIEVIQIPGHSPCPSALYVQDEQVIISGDTLDGADRRGFPKGYLLPPPEMYNWDHAQAERGLEKFLDYEFDSVYVHHGGHIHENAKEKLDRFLNFKQHYSR